jgi:pyruvate dehydrogenase E2 component (dihydrolipoamide acetyltransferase)
MADFLMPALGADMETGKVVQWLVAPGARVKPGDIVAVVETHKGAIDVEIFLEGVIDELVPVGTELRVGALLARVRGDEHAPASPTPAAAEPSTTAPVSAAPRARARHVPQPVAASPLMSEPEGATRAKVSPAARRRATSWATSRSARSAAAWAAR